MNNKLVKTQNIEKDEFVVPGPFKELWQSFYYNKGAVLGLIIIVILVFLALFAPLIAPHSPIEQYRTNFLQAPVWVSGDWNFILGTDDVGRDILSRLLYGARISLTIGFSVVTVSLIIGVGLGLISGYFRGWADMIIMRVIDMLMALPSLLLAIALIAVLGPSLSNAMIAVAIVEIPSFTRLTRAAVIQEMSKDYVIASEIIGARSLRQMFINILPNCVPPLIVQACLGFSGAILACAALGFLGMGAQAPTAEWGTMLSDGRSLLQRAPWVIHYPGMCIFITLLSINLIGDGLRDALDPKLKR
ncbi:dipeptide/heme ABC transporter permease [Gammaproteobacteria bacterium]|nr:dipeptide/heme ABC transporter permease [Gammaproteobacteria bacterium]